MSNHQLTKWEKYLRDTPKSNLLDMQNGDVYYLETLNRDPDTSMIESSKFRPVLMVQGSELQKHPHLTQQFNTTIKSNYIYALPLSTTSTNKKEHQNDQKYKYDVDVRPFDLKYEHDNVVYEEKKTKPSFARGMSIYAFDDRMINDMFDHFDDPALQQRKIGHMSEKNLSLLLDTIGDKMEEQNKDTALNYWNNGKRPNMSGRTMSPNPTRLKLHLENPALEQAANLGHAKNDPDFY